MVLESSDLVEQDLLGAGIRQAMGIIMVGMKQSDGHMMFIPPPTSKITSHSVLITLEESSAIKRLERIANGGASG